MSAAVTGKSLIKEFLNMAATTSKSLSSSTGKCDGLSALVRMFLGTFEFYARS